MVGKRFELLRIAAVFSRNFRFKTNFPYSTLVSAAPPRQKWSYFSDGLEGGSSVYEHALKFQRPSSIKYSHDLNNSVSFIGIVIHPLKRVDTNTIYLGVYTMLRVLGTCHPDRGVWIQLKIWGCLAEECLNHMKQYDLIHVNGELVSYTKGVEDRILYEVNVKEIYYVAPVIGPESCGKTENSLTRGEHDKEWWGSRLHLWQVFFASPYEWKDLRKSKTKPGQPDFINKSTGEALWLSRRDPPWLRQQLQKLDSADQRPYLAGEDDKEWWRSPLHLWQVFFASPYEWTDLRKRKTKPIQPDFINKSTGEALWLSHRDPPWLRQQLQKLDSADQRPYLAGEDDAERQRSRLHLWQVFFASPYEWRDLRMSKTNPRQPDFALKSTGEALWLSHHDPPWLRQQLQKLDSAMKDQSPEDDQRPYLAVTFCEYH